MLNAVDMMRRLLALAIIFAVTLSAVAHISGFSGQSTAQPLAAKADFVASLGMEAVGSPTVLVASYGSGCKGNTHGAGASAGCFGDVVVATFLSFTASRRLDVLRWADAGERLKRSAPNPLHRPPISGS